MGGLLYAHLDCHVPEELVSRYAQRLRRRTERDLTSDANAVVHAKGGPLNRSVDRINLTPYAVRRCGGIRKETTRFADKPRGKRRTSSRRVENAIPRVATRCRRREAGNKPGRTVSRTSSPGPSTERRADTTSQLTRPVPYTRAVAVPSCANRLERTDCEQGRTSSRRDARFSNA